MPVESKPLFRPDVLRPLLKAFRLPDRVGPAREALARWAEMFAEGRADAFKEQELLPDFLTDVFCGVLGYTRAVDGREVYTLSREKHVQVDGKFADAVLGAFRPGSERFVVAVEGKGPRDPLDRPFAGRKMSAVDQGYRYAINLPCDWIVVTSMRETRLYHKGSDQYTYERFETRDLAADDALLRKFVFLLGAERVVPEAGPCHFDGLLKASDAVGKALTKEFYLRYAEMRERAFELLVRANPGVDPDSILTAAQKLLDRILFCSFCEDRGLLPPETVRRAYEHSDPYNPRPIWDNFRGLFKAVNLGNPKLDIPAYNGGLFADDPRLDALSVPDEVCRFFQDLAGYDYRPAGEVAEEGDPDTSKLVDVDILGHIFEQSITDLERLRNEMEGRVERLDRAEHASRRKKEGAFYTPAFITRYIVGQALGRVLDDRFEALRRAQAARATRTTRRVLQDPSVYDLEALNEPQRKALEDFWNLWQEELAGVRILDPSCGSGAFLIEAFEQLYQAYQRSLDRLDELRADAGQRQLFDLDRHILQNNLYGVDLNEEAVQICRLSLWIKTARRGKVLTSLDRTIRVGNSVVHDPEAHPRAFRWEEAFPEVFEAGGFDVVVGNPPYIRQEWIAPIKPFLQKAYASYHGVADLYVYFYELGLRVLKPGGRLSFIVTNKWLKAAYGEPLRRLFAERSWIEDVVDFGHAKQIFPEADVFPCILIARKPAPEPEAPPDTTRVCAIPRELLRIDDLNVQIDDGGSAVERARLGPSSWSLEPKSVYKLVSKIRDKGVPLSDISGEKPFYGVKTGCNDAFIIDESTKNRLVKLDSHSRDLIRPYLRGQDVRRWCPEWSGFWMIFTRRGIDISLYPAIENHLLQFRDRLEPKPKDWAGLNWAGRKPGKYLWFETQDPVDYWQLFGQPKIMYQDITWRPSFCLDCQGTLSNDTTFFIPTTDLWLLACLNSPVSWWLAWRLVQHGKDDALRLKTVFMQDFPIPEPRGAQRDACSPLVSRLIEVTRQSQLTAKDLIDWFCVEHEIEKPTLKLQNALSLDSDALIAEVRKVRGRKKPLSLAGLKSLREEHARTIVPAQALAAEARALESRISDLVNEAYGLTPDEVRLMWETAPPRMPVAPPPGIAGPDADAG